MRFRPSRIFTPLAALPALAGAGIAQPVLTFHNDNARSGWYSHETRLTRQTVASPDFGRKWSTKVDAEVYGSPLYVPGLSINGRKHDVVYAATENNSVYALDAGSGKVLWGPRHLANALTNAQFSGAGGTMGHKGITCTPVIDLKSNTIYVAGLCQPRIKQICKVWALDILTGTIKRGWPVTIHGNYRGCAFDAGQLLQRGALLLNGRSLYLSFGARQDIPDWHGWVVSVDVDYPSRPQHLFSTDPNVDGGGVWGVAGVASDAHGNIFAVTGNGGYDLNKGGLDLGQAVFRLTPNLGFSYKPSDFYVPTNFQYLNDTDQDLGGSGPLLLPDLPTSSTPHLLVTAGKDGLVYLLDRDNFGGLGGELQKLRLYGDPTNPDLAEIRATPTYMRNQSGDIVVYVSGYDAGPTGCAGITALKVTSTPGHKAHLEQVWTLPAALSNPDTPALSSNGSSNGIVWVLEEMGGWGPGGGAGVLDAFDAETGKRLFPADGQRDKGGFAGPVHFACPTIADGSVYFGTSDSVIAFGLKDGGKEAAK